MDRVTQAQIDSLLYELRALQAGEAPLDVEELGRKFRLDPMIVARIAQAEGIELCPGLNDEESDPNQTTAVMSQDELRASLEDVS